MISTSDYGPVDYPISSPGSIFFAPAAAFCQLLSPVALKGFKVVIHLDITGCGDKTYSESATVAK